MAEPPAQPKPRLTFGQRSDVGMVRRENHDSALSIVFADDSSGLARNFGIFIIADGEGEKRVSAKASRLVTQLVSREGINMLHEMFLSGEQTFDETRILNKLTAIVQQAESETKAKVPEEQSTCTAVIVAGTKAFIAHYGGTATYHITDTKIERITEHSSALARLAKVIHLSNRPYWERPEWLEVLHAPWDITTYTIDLTSPCYLLLCSDGVWGLEKEREMQAMVLKAETPQKACDVLVELANKRGGNDNITAIVVQIP